MNTIRHLLYRQRLSDDMGKTNGRVVHEDQNLLAQQLTVSIPDDRILIHGHAGILRIENQGIADGLHIKAIGTDLRISMHLTVYRIGIDMEGIDTHGIRMNPKSIFLRIVDRYRIAGGKAITGFLVVTQIIASKGILALLIYINHIAISGTLSILYIIERITRKCLVFIYNRRTAIKLCSIGLGIIISVFCLDNTCTRNNLRRSYHVSL